MRHIYNGEEGDFTDLTVVALPEPASGTATQPSNLAALPPRCVFSCLTQNMCVGESTTGLQRISHPKYNHVFCKIQFGWEWLFSVFVNKAINAQSVKINHKKSQFIMHFCGQKIRQIKMTFANNQFSRLFSLFLSSMFLARKLSLIWIFAPNK